MGPSISCSKLLGILHNITLLNEGWNEMFNFVSKYFFPVFSICQSFNHVSHLTTFNVDRIGLPGYSMSSCHNDTVAEIVKLLKNYHHKKWTTFRGAKWRDIEHQLDMVKHQPSVVSPNQHGMPFHFCETNPPRQ